MDEARRGALGCAVILVVAGLSAEAHAYTLKTTASGARVRWHRADVALSVVMMGEPERLSRDEVVRALSRAAAAWEIPGVPRISVREGRAAESWAVDGVNGVYVLARWPFEDRRLAVTVSTYAEATGELIDADILINGEMPFAVLADEREHGMPGAPYDLDLVLTHELGHVLGIDESEIEEATMWHRIGRGEMSRRTLAVDDVDAALALYPAGALDAPAGCSVSARGGVDATWLSGMMAIAALAGVRRRGKHVDA